MDVSTEVGYSRHRLWNCWTSRRVIGRHYGGPTWQHNDGSLVEEAVVSKQLSPEATSIPWLLLSPFEEPEGWKRCNSYNAQRHKEELRPAELAAKLPRYESHTQRCIRFMGEG
jgi:hypothetical protein